MFKILIVAVTFFTSYLNYKVYESYKAQVDFIFDFNSNQLKSENYIKLQNLDKNFPNLSATSFPMFGLLARYQIAFGDYNQAIDNLNNNINDNPYLRVKESLKAEIYFNLGVRDSSLYYSKIAYENLPKNAKHFQQYIKELVHIKDYETINEIFLKSEAKNNSDYWINYFSAIVDKEVNFKNTTDSLAYIALEKFPQDEKIKTLCAYILFGSNNIKKSYELNKEGIENFDDTNYSIAAEKFIEAIKLNPTDYTFFENAGMSLINSGNYKDAIQYFENVLNRSDRPIDGKSEFGLATCYFEMGQRDLACDFYRKSMRLSYLPAYARINDHCN